MSEPKKISFGFSKIIKKQEILKPKQNDVQLIDCIESQTIKVIGSEQKEGDRGPLIIPLKRKDATSNLISIIKEETGQTESNVTQDEEKSVSKNALDVYSTNGEKTLEVLAAEEIIKDLNKVETTSTKIFHVPLPDEVQLTGEKESTLEDYENIPIADFGLAMLRGMGWEEGKGIGKTEKQIAVSVPELRPKGLGLGADRPAAKATNSHGKSNTKEEDLQIKKGAYVRVVMGKNVDAYGQIEGLDDDAGRLFVKMALGGSKVSFSEFMVEAVTKAEYDKNSRVLNSKKYAEYKNQEGEDSKKIDMENYDDKTIKSDKSSKNIKNEKSDIKTEEYSRTKDSYRDKIKNDDGQLNLEKGIKKEERENSHDIKNHKSKKSHKKHKKSKKYDSDDSSSSDERKKDKRKYRSPDRSRSAYKSENKSRRRSRSRDKTYSNSKYRH